MNPAKMLHRVNMERNVIGADPQTGLQTRNFGLDLWAVNIRCLIEGIAGKSRPSILGRVQGAKYIVTWIGEELRQGDALTVTSGPTGAVGRTFRLEEILDDTGRRSRPYYTGILTEWQPKR